MPPKRKLAAAIANERISTAALDRLDENLRCKSQMVATCVKQEVVDPKTGEVTKVVTGFTFCNHQYTDLEIAAIAREAWMDFGGTEDSSFDWPDFNNTNFVQASAAIGLWGSSQNEEKMELSFEGCEADIQKMKKITRYKVRQECAAVEKNMTSNMDVSGDESEIRENGKTEERHHNTLKPSQDDSGLGFLGNENVETFDNSVHDSRNPYNTINLYHTNQNTEGYVTGSIEKNSNITDSGRNSYPDSYNFVDLCPQNQAYGERPENCYDFCPELAKFKGNISSLENAQIEDKCKGNMPNLEYTQMDEFVKGMISHLEYTQMEDKIKGNISNLGYTQMEQKFIGDNSSLEYTQMEEKFKGNISNLECTQMEEDCVSIPSVIIKEEQSVDDRIANAFSHKFCMNQRANGDGPASKKTQFDEFYSQAPHSYSFCLKNNEELQNDLIVPRNLMDVPFVKYESEANKGEENKTPESEDLDVICMGVCREDFDYFEDICSDSVNGHFKSRVNESFEALFSIANGCGENKNVPSRIDSLDPISEVVRKGMSSNNEPEAKKKINDIQTDMDEIQGKKHHLVKWLNTLEIDSNRCQSTPNRKRCWMEEKDLK